MSRGKYSPTVNYSQGLSNNSDFSFNCYGQPPVAWPAERVEYDEKTMFGNYDRDGYDRYGYSAFDRDGNYVGIGNGVDRNGYTEFEYLSMSSDEFFAL